MVINMYIVTMNTYGEARVIATARNLKILSSTLVSIWEKADKASSIEGDSEFFTPSDMPEYKDLLSIFKNRKSSGFINAGESYRITDNDDSPREIFLSYVDTGGSYMSVDI